ncbi:MAG TPA: hypothetical protein VFC51_04810, partial [Chloroflexota bacterium]|nr:hypothetical protein [Chloroflexota bacterium]
MGSYVTACFADRSSRHRCGAPTIGHPDIIAAHRRSVMPTSLPRIDDVSSRHHCRAPTIGH